LSYPFSVAMASSSYAACRPRLLKQRIWTAASAVRCAREGHELWRRRPRPSRASDRAASLFEFPAAAIVATTPSPSGANQCNRKVALPRRGRLSADSRGGQRAAGDQASERSSKTSRAPTAGFQLRGDTFFCSLQGPGSTGAGSCRPDGRAIADTRPRAPGSRDPVPPPAKRARRHILQAKGRPLEDCEHAEFDLEWRRTAGSAADGTPEYARMEPSTAIDVGRAACQPSTPAQSDSGRWESIETVGVCPLRSLDWRRRD